LITKHQTTWYPIIGHHLVLVDVKLSEGLVTLLVPKFILSMTFVRLISAAGYYTDYMKPGSSKHWSPVKDHIFGLDEASHVPQLIRYIGESVASVGEDVAKEIICAGCRELTGNLERYKDDVVLVYIVQQERTQQSHSLHQQAAPRNKIILLLKLSS
jgi:hypothetical protein